MEPNCLIGKTITAIHLAADKQAIKFEILGEAPIIAHCDADCCSYTWIENIENHEAILGSPVLEAMDLNMPDLGDMPDREVVAYYGFKISTVKGACTLDYRNDSNGYYGGNLTWPSEKYFYGGVYGQNISEEEWKKL